MFFRAERFCEKRRLAAVRAVCLLHLSLAWVEASIAGTPVAGTPAAGNPQDLSLHIETVETQGWRLRDVAIGWSGSGSGGRFGLSAAAARMPEPFEDVTFIEINCPDFGRTPAQFRCRQGRAKLQFGRGKPPQAIDFAFATDERSGFLTVKGSHMAGGSFTLSADKKGDDWSIKVDAASLSLPVLAAWLDRPEPTFKKGRVTFGITLSGRGREADRLRVVLAARKVDAQIPSGRYAVEKVDWDAALQARANNGKWRWRLQSRLKQGGLYAEPVYLDAGREPVAVSAEGGLIPSARRLEPVSFRYRHAGADISGSAVINLGQAEKIESASVVFKSPDIAGFAEQYLHPFLVQTPGEGWTFGGPLAIAVDVRRQAVKKITAAFNDLDIRDKNGRLDLQKGFGSVRWAKAEDFAEPSLLGWRQLSLQRLPIGASRLDFSAGGRRLSLIRPARLPFLGGAIAIDRFDWRGAKNGEPVISFQGGLRDASLERLTRALDWTPLAGAVSGVIPGVRYRNKTLTLDGQLSVTAFGGRILIDRLVGSGLAGDFPAVSGNLQIDDLDLEQLTGKFEFGGITGKLSGFIRQLRLENWRPSTFYAWFGTPEDDRSTHRISQKAVKNIASIGGGGAADMVSRGFLSLFETFGYGQLGLGCYLHAGVCQLMGVKAAPNGGYWIVTPGGLPRIEVIGYNPRVDWNVLMQRLKRIRAADEAVVK